MLSVMILQKRYCLDNIKTEQTSARDYLYNLRYRSYVKIVPYVMQ